MQCFEIIKSFISKEIDIDEFYDTYFYFYSTDRENKFDGQLVKFKGKYVQNKSEFLPYDPNISLLDVISSSSDQLEDMDFFEYDKTLSTKLLIFTIFCWTYHFELEEYLINQSLRKSLEPKIFEIIENINSLEWKAEDYINLFSL